MESINERRCSFQSLKNLIELIEGTNKKLILHFSWPYLPNVSQFLEDVKEDHPDAKILHMGKVFSKKLNEVWDEEKPQKFAMNLTLEGDLWDIIYNYDEQLLENKINYILPNYDYQNVSSAINYDFIIDSGVVRIKDIISNEKIDIRNPDINILKYPPFLNTFLPPGKMTRFIYDEERPMYLPLVDTIARKVDNEELVKHFKGIHKDLKPYCLVKHFNNLKTPNNIRKKTLLQLYLLNELFDIEKDNVINNIYLANMHPSLGSKSKMNEELKKILFCIKNQIDELKEIINFEKRNYSEIIDELERNNNFIIRRRKERNRLKIKIKLNTPLNYKRGKFGTEDFIPEKLGPTLAAINVRNERLQHKINFETIEVSEKTDHIELKLEKLKGRKRIKNDYIIEYKSLSNLRYLPNTEIKESLLLVPGPVPYHTIKDEKILISQGYDSFLLPFEKIVFFSYPGYNFLRLTGQLKSFKDLLINEESDAYNDDLSYSMINTNIKTKRNIKSNIEIDGKVSEEKSNDSPMDPLIRKDMLEKDEVEGEDDKDTLKGIFEQISTQENITSESSTRVTISDSYTEHITFEVELEDGSKKEIDFAENSLIRVLKSGSYELSPVEEVSPGNNIIYVTNRQTLDNELLQQFFSHVNYDLESILEPLTDLRIFYEVLKNVNFNFEFNPDDFKRITWLSNKEKETLFKLFKHAFNNNDEEFLTTYSNENNIWVEYLEPDNVWSIVSKKRRISQKLLADIADKLGLQLAKNTLKSYCSTNIGDIEHYSFNNSINICVIGKLIGNKRSINSYEEINKHGEKIKLVLMKIGRSISRVVSGKERMGNEMDMYVYKYLKKCTVKKVK